MRLTYILRGPTFSLVERRSTEQQRRERTMTATYDNAPVFTSNGFIKRPDAPTYYDHRARREMSSARFRVGIAPVSPSEVRRAAFEVIAAHKEFSLLMLWIAGEAGSRTEGEEALMPWLWPGGEPTPEVLDSLVAPLDHPIRCVPGWWEWVMRDRSDENDETT